MSNEELLTILKEHLARYPKMQPQDVVKLLYQNEFGPGHLVSDRTSCIERLEAEAAKVREDTAAKVRQDETVPVIEDIGNGLARVNLARLDAMNFSL